MGHHFHSVAGQSYSRQHMQGTSLPVLQALTPRNRSRMQVEQASKDWLIHFLRLVDSIFDAAVQFLRLVDSIFDAAVQFLRLVESILETGRFDFS
jgi:hypothetical protein